MQLVHNAQIPCSATGELLGIEEADGRRVAKIKLKATIAANGDAEEVGMQSGLFGGGRGGRGGRGGGFGGGESQTDVDIKLAITGTAWVDMESGLVTSVMLRGGLEHETMMESVMDRGGEEMVFEMNNATDGTLVVNVDCAMTQGN